MKSVVHPCAAVILAAGASARMGSPKALLEIGGETFLDRLIGLFSPLCYPVITVLGRDAARIRAGIARAAQSSWVVNPEPEMGMLSSLQAGLAAVPGECRSTFFHPCDMPQIQFSTVRHMLETLSACEEETFAAVPSYNGLRGHPVLIRSSSIPAFLALPAGAKPRSIFESAPRPVVEVPVGDEAVRRDYDTPEQYIRAFGVQP